MNRVCSYLCELFISLCVTCRVRGRIFLDLVGRRHFGEAAAAESICGGVGCVLQREDVLGVTPQSSQLWSLAPCKFCQLFFVGLCQWINKTCLHSRVRTSETVLRGGGGQLPGGARPPLLEGGFCPTLPSTAPTMRQSFLFRQIN